MKITYQFPFPFKVEENKGSNPSPACCRRWNIVIPTPTKKWFYCRGGWGKSQWIRIFGLRISWNNW